MKNAKEEFLNHVKNNDVLCAEIIFGNEDYVDNKKYILKIGYSKNDLYSFLFKLNFEYDNGYGRQELFGNIWYKNGDWSERFEYDGSECWHHKSLPNIPDYLRG